jgi:uncharacterized protein YcfJ
MIEIENDEIDTNIMLQNINRYPCPHCASLNTTPVNSKTIASTAAGGIIGGLLTGLIAYFTKGSMKSIVNSSIAGVLGGTSVGFKFGQSTKIEASDKVFLCLDCLHSFNRA